MIISFLYLLLLLVTGKIFMIRELFIIFPSSIRRNSLPAKKLRASLFLKAEYAANRTKAGPAAIRNNTPAFSKE